MKAVELATNARVNFDPEPSEHEIIFSTSYSQTVLFYFYLKGQLSLLFIFFEQSP